MLNDHLQSLLPDGTHWSTIAVGASIPYSVVRAMRASGSVAFGTVSRCGSAGCVCGACHPRSTPRLSPPGCRPRAGG
eukprot:9717242-Alexandrium_andersonii.AAC.1